MTPPAWQDPALFHSGIVHYVSLVSEMIECPLIRPIREIVVQHWSPGTGLDLLTEESSHCLLNSSFLLNLGTDQMN